jgi:hypothetical protein
MVKPLLSVEIIKDVEKFTSTVTMDHESVVSVMLYGTVTPPVGGSLKGLIIKPQVESLHKDHHLLDCSSSVNSTADVDASDASSHYAHTNCSTTSVPREWNIAELAETRKQATMMAAQRALSLQQRKRPYKYEIASEVLQIAAPQIASQCSAAVKTELLADTETTHEHTTAPENFAQDKVSQWLHHFNSSQTASSLPKEDECDSHTPKSVCGVTNVEGAYWTCKKYDGGINLLCGDNMEAFVGMAEPCISAELEQGSTDVSCADDKGLLRTCSGKSSDDEHVGVSGCASWG